MTPSVIRVACPLPYHVPSSKSTPPRSSASAKSTPHRRPPRALDAWEAIRALREAGLVWEATRLGGYPPPVRHGVTVIHVRGQRVGVHVEVGPPDSRRERMAAAQGWVYIPLVPGADALRVVDAMRAHRRALAHALGERDPFGPA